MGMRYRPIALVLAALYFVAPAAALAQGPDTVIRFEGDDPVALAADELTHHRERGLVTAVGNVEITQGNRVLRADKIVYDIAADRMSASGNIVMVDPDGGTIRADTAEVSRDFKDGAMQEIRLRFRDNSRFDGAAARQIGGTRTEIDEASYTTCPVCEESPARSPAWRIRAGKVVRDTDDKTVTYRDAVLELWGVPVLYTPYFSHADIGVKRQTGLLVPTFGRDHELGVTARIPVFWAIAPDKDATITPILTEKEGVVGLAEYRQRFPGGALRIAGSITRGSTETEANATRGHLDADIDYHLDHRWRTGMTVRLASDDTYLGRYDFSDEKTLTSNFFVEGFFERNYVAANLYRFQGLRPSDDPATIPLVIPELDFNFLGARDRLGGRIGVDANLRGLVREVGADSARLSLNAGWQLPYISRGGQRIDLFARVQADGYLVDGMAHPDDPEITLSGFEGRFFPQVGVDWRYPLVRYADGFAQIVEPIFGIVAAPRGGNPDGIPNEDSLNLGLDDTNVFDRSRATGLDLVEDGQRIYYGVQGWLFGGDGVTANAFLGQSLRLGGTDLFPSGAGLDGDLSDFVGRLDLRIDDRVRLLYRFRYDHAEFASLRDEIGLDAGSNAFRVSANYLSVDEQAPPLSFGKRREINFGLRTRITDSATFRGEIQRDLRHDRSLWYRSEIGYRHDCFDLSFSYKRTLTSDRDILPNDSFLVRFRLTGPGA